MNAIEIVDPFENVELDRAMLSFVDENLIPIYRLYAPLVPCLTYGAHQVPESELVIALERMSMPLVQRPTGGLEAIHLPSDLLYSIAIPRDHSIAKIDVVDAFRSLQTPVAQAFESIGLRVEFDASRYASGSGRTKRFCFLYQQVDALMVEGRKCVGGAILKGSGGLLLEGTISLSIDYQMLERVFSFRGRAFLERLEKRACGLNEIFPKTPLEKLRLTLLHTLSKQFDLFFQRVYKSDLLLKR